MLMPWHSWVSAITDTCIAECRNALLDMPPVGLSALWQGRQCSMPQL